MEGIQIKQAEISHNLKVLEFVNNLNLLSTAPTIYQINQMIRNDVIWLALENEDIVGIIGLDNLDDRIPHVSKCGIRPSHQKRGLADKLLQEAENFAKNFSYDGLQFHVNRGGFETEASTKRGYLSESLSDASTRFFKNFYA